MPTPWPWYDRAAATLERERMPHKDPVTEDVYREVMQRDEYRCIAPLLDENAGACHGRWDEEFWGRPPRILGYLTLDHVGDKMTIVKGMSVAGAKLGSRAKSDPRHLVVLCWGHHLGGWAETHRDLERDYLQGRYST